MRVWTIVLAAALSLAPGLLQAQFDFKLAGRSAQVHSFASEGFAYTNVNNYLTMKTSQGSFAMTDGGVNLSMQMTDKFRVGAQVYVRNIGNLGQWRPSLDWAVADYRLYDWLGLRAGKVKTVLGLYNDTQDVDSLHTFALLPQSIYPMDMRDSTIAHTGVDLYGNISMKRVGSLSYNAFTGHRQDSLHGGYPYLLKDRNILLSSWGGFQYGADLRWNTPLKGVLAGASYLREFVGGEGTVLWNPARVPDYHGPVQWGPYKESPIKSWTQQFYGQYVVGNLKIDSEYRRFWRNTNAYNGLLQVWTNQKSWYASAAYRVSKRLELGAYHSLFWVTWKRSRVDPALLDTSLPDHHLYDKVIAARFDLTKFWNVKVEGHFMDGWGGNFVPDGFYKPDNPNGIQPRTNLLLIRTGWSF